MAAANHWSGARYGACAQPVPVYLLMRWHERGCVSAEHLLDVLGSSARGA
ncbi:hypothetical protein MAPG_10460 [Magnaporthiopsis poae ATCC 64411]|uniref:Uncharacterized protein n=1 Tax=Magnaporthiopsis poae (strain ATCC 64411 / 73-15) TaxID=644358 RepID=A0A0C4ECM9_MAGP6|nr:hypothetical protein MAPG_10460 [Magnaporthiopsis poae ATCC 64411]